jgi:hypothetical protein
MTEIRKADGLNTPYTKKSGIYQALQAVLYEHEEVSHFLEKLLAEVEEFRRMDAQELLIRMGLGWPSGEAFLKAKVAEILAPEQP